MRITFFGLLVVVVIPAIVFVVLPLALGRSPNASERRSMVFTLLAVSGGFLLLTMALFTGIFFVRSASYAPVQAAVMQVVDSTIDHPPGAPLPPDAVTLENSSGIQISSSSAASTTDPDEVREEEFESSYSADNRQRGFQITAQSLDSVPEWAADPKPPTHDGRRTAAVLVSKRYATISEAEQDLDQQLLQEVNEQMVSQYPVLAQRGIQWANHPDLFKQIGILKRQCITTSSLQVGEEKVPVHQVYWDIELTPETAQRLYASWKPMLIRDRLVMLGGALAAMTAGLGISSFALRRFSSRQT